MTGIVTESDSAWFGGQAGLTLAHPRAIDPIPAKGALGYFAWARTDAFAPVKPWMTRYGSAGTGDLFDAALSFKTPPEKPFG